MTLCGMIFGIDSRDIRDKYISYWTAINKAESIAESLKHSKIKVEAFGPKYKIKDKLKID